ncbi:MAG: hypothetical protein IPM63_03965 [Acidobacteriota bacterium]|nr:MAG: hypothetical protein IPM63_03965 [Acidobacteriota bacterium]
MKNILKPFVSAFLIAAFAFSLIPPAFPCGPADLVPVFGNDRAPEFPFTGFADGKLGIVNPEFPRIVLFAAYRYMNGSNFSAYEREAMVEAWKEFFSHAADNRDDVNDAIKDWINERASVVGEEENPPEIYAEKPYSDLAYEFFPNCAKDAFVTARETLSDRTASHGTTDPWVLEWIRGQDAVFWNCAESKRSPAPVSGSMPEWLQKDRAYQLAAADFYALSYERARERFAAIANDPDSPWQEVAEYLVPRTLIREASLSKNKEKSREIYALAEQSLENVYAGGGKYSDAAEKLIGLVKYRLHPQQRVQELAQNLSYYGGGNLKQDLIDYTWLLAKYEAEALETEEKRKEEEITNSPEARRAAAASNSANSNSNDMMRDATNRAADEDEFESEEARRAAEKGLVSVYFYNDDFSQSWTIWIDPEGTDEDAFAVAEAAAGPLTERMMERIREARRIAYQNRFEQREEDYQGRYYGDEETSIAILPAFLMTSDLTEWLFTFQIAGEAAYEHSLNKYRQTNSDAWLVAALVKANARSKELNSILDSARAIGITSPAFPTAAYHRARLLLELGRKAEAKTALDEVLNSSADIPISARNEMAKLRMGLADSLEDFLKHALRKPYAFAWDTEFLSIDEMIEREKSYYDPEYYEESREEYERKVEESYRYAKAVESELMLDSDSVEVINYHFPFDVLLKVHVSPIVPDYLKGRLALVIWTRAALLGEWKIADLVVAEAVRHHPEIRTELEAYAAARSEPEKKNAALFAMLKNEQISPYLASGFGSPMESISYASRWWCEPYDEEWDDEKQEMVPIKVSDRPAFLTALESQSALDDMKKLKEVGNAPKFFGERVLEWAAGSPSDPRIPEALYITWSANGWDKYGCQGDPVDREKLKALLLSKYAATPWAQRLLSEEL